jgi:hypothetical protein
VGEHLYELINEYQMKKGILLGLLFISVIADAQTLKDALYSGKLKTDAGTVIRKGDSLSAKMDTSRKKTIEPEKIKTLTAAGDTLMKGMLQDSSMKGLADQADSTKTQAVNKVDSAVVSNDNNVAPKDNNKIWKEYMDSVVSTLKTEVLTSKKIKSGSYFVLVDYEIDVDGQVTINNVTPSPENSFLQQQVKERLTLTAPRMNPVMFNGKPRKVVKRANFTVSK